MADFTLSNSVYDKLKKLTQVGLPAIGSLYFGLSNIWNWAGAEEVVGSLALITTFLGLVLGASSKNYDSDKDIAGDFVIDTNPDGTKVVRLDLNDEASNVIERDRITFKVVDTEKQFWNGNEEAFDNLAT
jgi:hypothetical protein